MAISGRGLLIFEWLMVAFCLLLIFFRFAIRLRYRGGILTWADFFVFMAWCIFAVNTSMDIRLNQLGFFRPEIDPFSPTLGNEIGDAEMLKIFFVGSAIYLIGLYAVKFSVLCFYSEIIPERKKRTLFAYRFIVVYTAVGSVVTLLMGLLTCLPIDRNWSTDPKETCNAGWSNINAAVSWMFHLSSDLLIYILPLTLLPGLNLTPRQKVGVGLTFGVGFLCLFFASAVIAASFLAHTFAVDWIMCAFEQTWAIAVVCVPSFRALAFWRRTSRPPTPQADDVEMEEGEGRKKSNEIARLYGTTVDSCKWPEGTSREAVCEIISEGNMDLGINSRRGSI